MRLICPSCGAAASAEAWQNDSTCRYFFEALVQLPAPVLSRALPYLGLFRQGGKSLPWRRAFTIVRSLKELVEPGTVHWQGGETRPITAQIWGDAMEAALAAGPKGLKNHNYLRHVAWEMAAELAAKTEADREAAKKRRAQERAEEPEPLSEVARRAVDDLKRKWRQP